MKTTKETLERIRCDRATSNPVIIIHFVGKPKKNNIQVTGYPIIKGVPHYEMKKKRKAYSNEDADVKMAEMVTDFEVVLFGGKKRKSNNTKSNANLANSDYEKAFEAINTPDLFKPQWAKSTAESHLVWFRRNILSYIIELKTIEEFDLDELIENIKKSVDNNKRTIKKNIAKNVQLHLYHSQIIYEKMRTFNDDLPEFTFFIGEKMEKGYVAEKIKSLPYHIIIDLRPRVENMIEEDPLMARAIALMESAGARTAEAAAPNKIIDYGEFVVVAIRNQMKNKEISGTLKTPDSYRVVVLDDWGAYIVRQVEEVLQKRGIESNTPIMPTQISVCLKKILVESGVTDSMIAGWRGEMLKDIELCENDVTAYILRRYRASVWEHFCGYSKDLIDSQLGHAVRVDWNSKIENNKKKYAEIYEKLVRYDISEKCSNSARNKPIRLEPNLNVHIENNNVAKMKNTSDKPIKVTVFAESRETGDPICLNCKEGKIETITSISVKNNNKTRKNDELIIPIENMKYEYQGGDKQNEN